MDTTTHGLKTHIFARFFLFVFLFLFWLPGQMELRAQYNIPQNDVWAFAYGQGVNFLPGPAPVSLPSSTNTYEGSASICSSTGSLLFYTAGSTSAGTNVFDRTGAVMPHGGAIVPYPTYSCTQAAAIVPVIGNPNQYYVFSLEQGGDGSWGGTPNFCHLDYCIVDMTLHGGLGDVVASTRMTPVDSGLCEKMTVTAGDNCNIWLLVHEKDAPIFKAYSITAAGISAPVLSTATGETPTGTDAYKIGSIKVSPDRTMISNVMLNGAYGGGDDRLELLFFNAATGIVSGAQILNSFLDQYDAEFSPDNSKLYSRVLGYAMYQYDLSLLPSISAVVASQNIVYTSPDWGGQIKLGPDGKIYAQTNVGYLDCLNSPNLLGSLCNYTNHAVSIGGSGIGLPNIVIVAPAAVTDTSFGSHDTSLCMLPSITLAAPTGYSSYLWNTAATTDTINVTTAGTYWVIAGGSCGVPTLIDTFHVVLSPPVNTSHSSDTSACALAGSIILNAPSGGSDTWSTGSTGTSVTVSANGTYWVTNTNGCTTTIDTFHVTLDPVVTTSHSSDTSVCTLTGGITLAAPAGYATYTWNTGSTASSVGINTSGTYWVISANGCTYFADTFNVTLLPSPEVALGNDTTVCKGSSITLGSAEPAGAQYTWNTGSNDSSIIVGNAGVYGLTVTVGSCSAYGTIQVIIGTMPVLYLGADTVLCQGDTYMLTSTVPLAWSTGTTGTSIAVTDSGIYVGSFTNTCGTVKDSIKVSFDPCDLYFPSAFTPNGDGRNDIARAVGYLSKYTNYTLSIYNRWGQRVYYTHEILEGWDGTYAGEKQDIDVYFWMITYTLEGKNRMMKGDLTLIR